MYMGRPLFLLEEEAISKGTFRKGMNLHLEEQILCRPPPPIDKELQGKTNKGEFTFFGNLFSIFIQL